MNPTPTIKIPRVWLEKLVKYAEEMGGAHIDTEHVAAINHLIGYIESAKALLD